MRQPWWILGCLLLCYGCTPVTETHPTEATDYLAFAKESEVGAVSDPAMRKLVAAYPDFLVAAEGNEIVWKDGTRMVWDDGRGSKTFAQLEEAPDLQDMFAFAYPKDSILFQENFDPGRIRNDAFFKKMYGATQAEASKKLVTIPWLDGAVKLQVTHVNGVDQALRAVSAELTALSKLRKYLTTPGGTFNWRVIAGTDRLSAHSYGMAMDIHVGYSDYWRWSPEFKAGKALVYHNQIPMEIVHVFERHGFIWGGKWYHYDTMHFEYRPELF